MLSACGGGGPDITATTPTFKASQQVTSIVTTINRTISAVSPLTVSGGKAPYTYTASGLPPGVSISASTGALSGTPTQANTYAAQITVTDAVQTANLSYPLSITVNESPTVTITGASGVFECVASQAGCTLPSVNGARGTPPFVFSVSPALPAGLTLNTATGAISGQATASSALSTYTVTAIDAAGAVASATFQLSVVSVLRLTVAVPEFACGESNGCNATSPFTPVTVSGGTAPYSFSVAPTLPTGMTLNAQTGSVTGTVSAPLVQTAFIVKVTDAANRVDSATVRISGLFAQVSDVACVVNAPCSVKPLSENATGKSPYVFSAQGLPAGLSIVPATGVISGTPTSIGTAQLTVTVTDALGRNVSKTSRLTVSDPSLSTTVAIAEVGCGEDNGCTAVSPFTPVTASGGTAPYTFSVAPALPTGMSMNASGAVSGTPTAGTAPVTFTVTVRDNAAPQATSSKTFVLSALFTTATNVNCPLSTACTVTPVTPNATGKSPYTFAITSGALPTGYVLNATTGAIAGTSDTPIANTPLTIRVTDALGRTSAKSVTFTVQTGAFNTTLAIPEVNCGETNACTVASPFTPVTASGGTAPYTFSIPTLPSGMSFNTATGAITGVPDASASGFGPTPYLINVRDNAVPAGQLSRVFTLSYLKASASNVSCAVGAACSASPITVIGGKAPFTYALAPASPPLGGTLAINANTGAISGTAAAVAGSATISVRVTDAAGRTSTPSFTLSTSAGLIANSVVAEYGCGESNGCAPLTPFTPVTASGGTAPYQYTAAPALPPGMSLNLNTGAITGAPSAALTQTSFTITVKDATLATATAGFKVSAIYTVASNGSCTVNVACSFTPLNAGASGKGPITYSVTSGTLPNTLTLNSSTGAISGTPAAPASPTVSITATDALGRSSTKSVTITIAPAPLVATTVVPEFGCGELNGCSPATPFTPVAASGGTPPYTYSPTPTLVWLNSLNPSTGVLTSGPSSALAQTTITVNITDSNLASASSTFKASYLAAQLTGNTSCSANTACNIQPVSGLNSGKAPLVFSISSGSLPGGLTINSGTGFITGTATAGASAPLAILITDALGRTASRNFTLTVSAPVLWSQVSAGFFHTCALSTTGAAYCWGRNTEGSIGDGTLASGRAVPTAVSGGLTFADISAGATHTCARTSGGTGYCWGANLNGPLGDGTSTSRTVPTAVSGGRSFLSIAAGNSFTCAVGANGNFGSNFCWGLNAKGQLGDQSTTTRLAPAFSVGDWQMSQMVTGDAHTCARDGSSNTYCWGYGIYGSLGNGSNADQSNAYPVSGGFPFNDLAAGGGTTCGRVNGDLWCWGRNDNGQVGDGSFTDRSTPVAVSGGLSFTKMSVGYYHTCGLIASGAAYCWGNNSNGQLGDGTTLKRSVPTLVGGGLTFVQISAGANHTCARTSAGALYCWGANGDRQLGDGTTTDRLTPTLVSPP